MACLFSKETAFGRMRGYRICNRWKETGVLRCPEGKCRLYKPNPHDTLLERRIEARLGDSLGCWCSDKAAQAEALRTVAGKIQEKIAELEETRQPAQTPDHSGKFVARDCINWSNNDHCAITKCNYCHPNCKGYVRYK